MGDQPAYSIVEGREVSFTREEILRAISIPDVLKEECPFTDWVNEIPSGSQRFREFCTNISDYDRNESFFES